ncbi:hypothetical protein ABK040_011051 [Willaertia magna]
MYEIIYFKFPARAEAIKLIAHVGKVPFTVKNLTQEEWKELKPKTIYGKIPILKRTNDDTFELHQSTAIARHLAKEGNLYPTNNDLSSKSEEIVMTIYDNVESWVRAAFYTEKKEEALQKYFNEELPFLLNILDKQLLENNKNQYLLGNELNWSDLWALDFVINMEGKGGNILEKFNNLSAWKKRLLDLQIVKEYYQSENNLRQVKL